MAEQQRVGPLVEGALLAAITALMGAMAIYLLPVKFLVDFIWGIPIIVIVKRHNLRIGMLTLAVTFFVTWLLSGPLMTVLLLVELAPLAVIYAVCFKRNYSPGIILTAGIAVSIGSAVLTVLGYYFLADVPLAPTEQAIRTQVGQIVDTYVRFGMDPMQARILAENVLRMVVLLIPSTIALASVVRAFLTYALAVNVLRRIGQQVRPLPPFRLWKLPWFSVWPFMVGVVMSLAGDQFKISILTVIGKNLVLLLLPVFFSIGLAVVVYFFKSWTMPGWVKLIIIVIAFLSLDGTIVLIALLGIFDPLVSFRFWLKRPKN